MAPISNAEKCKRYRARHQSKYREADALRKRHGRLLLKHTNPGADAARLSDQKIKKRIYRERKKNGCIQDAATTNLPTTPSIGTSSAFSQRHIKSRSLRKVESVLPKSPRKNPEIVESLAKKFQIRIQYKSTGRPKDDLKEEEKTWLIEFLDRTDISYATPGKNDQRYVGKIDG